MSEMNVDTAARIRRIRAALPADAFQPNPRRLVPLAAHTLVLLACYGSIRRWPAAAPPLSLVIGHSIACLGFVAHEVSHNAVVRNRALKYWVLMWAFGMNVVSPTMWNRLHNDAHHRQTGTPADPDRPFLESERCRSTTWYATWLYPSRTSRKTLLVFGHFVTYVLRHMATVFYPGASKPAVVTSKPSYRSAERPWILFEIAWMIALQYGIFLAVGGTAWAYLWAGPVSLYVASSVLMAYVFTQHFLNPIQHAYDPIGATTSLRVPRLIDRLHLNFSYHTEHHMFPTMNSEYYPLVSHALQKDAGESYSRLSVAHAWKRLWEEEAFRRTGGLGPHR